jgi:putative hydrolase of HD superfamily
MARKDSPKFDPESATAYLAGFPDLPESPEPRGARDIQTGRHIARAMQLIKRRQRHKNGTRQTNAEHSWMLGHMSTQFAGSQRDDLNPLVVQAMCHGHDLKEVHAGDTPINDENLKKSKVPREAAGLLLLIARDLARNPFMQDVLLQYEELEAPEARFVHAMDKFEPIEFDLENEGETYRYHKDKFPKLVAHQLPKTVADSHVFHLMTRGLVDVGQRWNDWGCVPFDGEPEEVVYSLRDQLISQKPDLRPSTAI